MTIAELEVKILQAIADKPPEHFDSAQKPVTVADIVAQIQEAEGVTYFWDSDAQEIQAVPRG